MRRIVFMLALMLALMPAAALAQTTTTTTQTTQTVPPPDENEMKDSYLAIWFGTMRASVKNPDTGESFDGEKKKSWGIAFGGWQRGILGFDIDLGITRGILGSADEVAGGTTDLLTLTANALIGPWINLSDNQALRPYGIIGGGLARSSFEAFGQIEKTSSNRGVIDFGGGIHAYLVKQLAVRFDYRIFKDFGQKEEHSNEVGFTSLSFKRVTFGFLVAF